MPPLPPDRRPTFLSAIGFPILLLLMEGGAAILWLRQQFPGALSAHGLTLVAASLFYLFRRVRKQNAWWPALYFLLLAGAGPFGGLIGLMSRVLTWFSEGKILVPGKVAVFAAEDQAENEALEEIARPVPAGFEETLEQPHIEPFVDLLRSGTLPQKQAVLEKITRYYESAYAPLLRDALNSKEAAIRVGAATALARLENNFMQRFMDLEKKHRADPENEKIMEELAACCRAYAEAGLVDSYNESSYLYKSLLLYEKLGQQHEDYFGILGHIYSRLDKPRAARLFFERRLKIAKRVEASFLLDYGNVLYKLKDWKRLRILAARYNKMVIADELGEHEEIAAFFKPWAVKRSSSLSTSTSALEGQP